MTHKQVVLVNKSVKKVRRDIATMNLLQGLALAVFFQFASCDLPPPDNVKFIIVAFRHGNRNPLQFLKGDTSHEEWAWEGPGQQTNIGKYQAYVLGQFLRKRYGNLIPTEFFPTSVKAYSPSAGCLITMQACMSGLFPPRGPAIWNPGLLWTPIPVEQSDPLLRMALANCPRYKDVYEAISTGVDPESKAKLETNPELISYISKNSGLNATLSDLADVAENIGDMKLQNATLPSWVTNPTLTGFPPRDMVDAIMSYSEAAQIGCASNGPCARLSAGYWLNQIIDTLQSIRNGTLKGRVANFYATHTETILSLIRLMKADVMRTNVKDVSTSTATAGLILEYTDTPNPSVRFLFHEPDANDWNVHTASLKSLAYCYGQQWCSLDTFIQNMQGSNISDWQTECNAPKCP